MLCSRESLLEVESERRAVLASRGSVRDIAMLTLSDNLIASCTGECRGVFPGNFQEAHLASLVDLDEMSKPKSLLLLHCL